MIVVVGNTLGRDRRGATDRPAFTLVELLVVVSIIALLISILLPSLRCAREQTKSAICIANLKGIATASNVYATDDPAESSVPIHHRMLVPWLTGGDQREIARIGWGGKAGRGRRNGDAFFWGTYHDLGPGARPLNKFLYKGGFINYRTNPGTGGVNWKKDQTLDLGLFRCPSDKGYTGINNVEYRDSGLSAYDFYGNSYATALIFIYTPRSYGCGGGPCCSSESPALRPLSRIPNPSNTLYYEEHAGRNAFWAAPQGKPMSQCGRPVPGIVHGWHPCRGEGNKGDWTFNVSFVDAHAGAVKMKGFTNPGLSYYPECPDGGQDCFGHWHCVIIRGSGWQKDCLPSPPVLTDVPCH